MHTLKVPMPVAVTGKELFVRSALTERAPITIPVAVVGPQIEVEGTTVTMS